MKWSGRSTGTTRALNLVGQPAVVVEPLGQVLELRRHLRDQLAVVAHLDLRQVLAVLLDEAGDLAHDLAARRLRHGRPGAALEGAMRGLDGAVYIGGVALRNERPRLAGVGVVGLKRLAGGGAAPFAVDVGLIPCKLSWTVQHLGRLRDGGHRQVSFGPEASAEAAPVQVRPSLRPEGLVLTACGTREDAACQASGLDGQAPSDATSGKVNRNAFRHGAIAPGYRPPAQDRGCRASQHPQVRHT